MGFLKFYIYYKQIPNDKKYLNYHFLLISRTWQWFFRMGLLRRYACNVSISGEEALIKVNGKQLKLELKTKVQIVNGILHGRVLQKTK